MKIPLLDLVAQYHNIREEIDQAIHEVLESGTFMAWRPGRMPCSSRSGLMGLV
jgi:hypothetical protein